MKNSDSDRLDTTKKDVTISKTSKLPNDDNGVAMLKTNPISEESTARIKSCIMSPNYGKLSHFKIQTTVGQSENYYGCPQTVSEGVSSTVTPLSLSDVTERPNTLRVDEYDTVMSQNSVGDCLKVVLEDFGSTIYEFSAVNDCVHSTSECASKTVILQSSTGVTSDYRCIASKDSVDIIILSSPAIEVLDNASKNVSSGVTSHYSPESLEIESDSMPPVDSTMIIISEIPAKSSIGSMASRKKITITATPPGTNTTTTTTTIHVKKSAIICVNVGSSDFPNATSVNNIDIL